MYRFNGTTSKLIKGIKQCEGHSLLSSILIKYSKLRGLSQVESSVVIMHHKMKHEADDTKLKSLILLTEMTIPMDSCHIMDAYYLLTYNPKLFSI